MLYLFGIYRYGSSLWGLLVSPDGEGGLFSLVGDGEHPTRIPVLWNTMHAPSSGDIQDQIAKLAKIDCVVSPGDKSGDIGLLHIDRDHVVFVISLKRITFVFRCAKYPLLLRLATIRLSK